MAGFRIGRGRDSRAPQQGQQGQQRGQQGGRPREPRQAPPPYGQQAPYGGPPTPPQGQQGGQQWPQPPAYGGPGPQGGHGGRGGHGGAQGGQGGHGEPEYFGGGGQDPYYGQGGQGPAPDAFNNSAGHTQAFSINEADAYGGPGGPGDPYGPGQGDGSYDGGDADTYRAGQSAAPPAGPRLHWKQLLRGIVLRPGPTFWQMRDYPVWGVALTVTFIYGLLAVFGFDKAREDVLNATLSNSIPWVISSGVALVISALILGAVTHTLARQLGGDGSWQPTIGLSMLIMSLTDAPRLLFAMFLGGDSTFVQALGWATWVAAGALFTSMVSKSHDLPWPKALGASAIQLLALLSVIKLGTL
ncbi:Yip1 family protein [Streptomyces sp. H27-D2]|uniref:Yip1 family protein n=1 Tax=Streptomyces sp. H27-D2 TaxID=3046304 RepID=UPI003FA69CE2